MATNKFVFCAMLLPVDSTIPGKACNSKRPSHFMRSTLQLGSSCIFCRTAQPSVMCSALSRVQRRSRMAGVVAKRSTDAGVRCVQTVEVRALPGDVEETITASCHDKTLKFDDSCFWLCHCVSGADQIQFFPTPRFRQTCGSKCRTPCGGRSAKRSLLNNSQQ